MKRKIYGVISCVLIWIVMFAIVVMGYCEYQSEGLEATICVICVVAYYLGFRAILMNDAGE